jgi:SpoIID/LytB domain protein
MSAEAPLEFLKAHAIASRSLLAAMLERLEGGIPMSPTEGREKELACEIIRWYEREEHDLFNVCADDHCQRYQGLTRMAGGKAGEAVSSTRGVFLVYDDHICDARYYKACGGLTDNFENAWEEKRVPYLTSVSDAPQPFKPILTEEDARAWILSRPRAYCNTVDTHILEQILPDFDRETMDFFRWEVRYEREELEDILRRKSRIDFGTLNNLIPLERGPSGRISRLRIEGSRRTVIVGKELEIRRWLSESHLYSSAFLVETLRDGGGTPMRFILKGAGWGHGVGLCQIGAAVMAVQGFSAEEILKHYFPSALLHRLYG